ELDPHVSCRPGVALGRPVRSVATELPPRPTLSLVVVRVDLDARLRQPATLELSADLFDEMGVERAAIFREPGDDEGCGGSPATRGTDQFGGDGVHVSDSLDHEPLG